MKVSIIIVSWNVQKHVSDCIKSIKKFPIKYDHEIIVIDNASHDQTVEYIQQHYPDVSVIKNNENRGFGFANNQGASIATGEYLFILNPDTLCLKDSINNLVEFMDHTPDTAMSGPRVLNENGTTQRSVRRFMTWKAAFCRYSLLKYFGIFKSDLKQWRYRDFDYNLEQEVEQLIGAALLIRRSIFEKLKGFDEQFFMYYEEVDLCYRINKMGLRNIYYPKAELMHLGGKSSSQVPAKKHFMILQSLVRYLKKNSSTSSNTNFLALLFKLSVLALQLYEISFYFIGYILSAVLMNTRKKHKYHRRYTTAYNFITKYYIKFFRT